MSLLGGLSSFLGSAVSSIGSALGLSRPAPPTIKRAITPVRPTVTTRPSAGQLAFERKAVLQSGAPDIARQFGARPGIVTARKPTTNFTPVTYGGGGIARKAPTSQVRFVGATGKPMSIIPPPTPATLPLITHTAETARPGGLLEQAIDVAGGLKTSFDKLSTPQKIAVAAAGVGLGAVAVNTIGGALSKPKGTKRRKRRKSKRARGRSRSRSRSTRRRRRHGKRRRRSRRTRRVARRSRGRRVSFTTRSGQRVSFTPRR